MQRFLLITSLICQLLFSVVVTTNGNSIVLSYSPNHSLRPPFESSQLGRFISSGDIDYGSQEIRLCHHRPHSRSALWCRQANVFTEWQAVLVFRVVGEKVGGGEGIAFWYARNLGQTGPVYGGPNRWHGLGVFVDVEGNAHSATNADGNQKVMGALSQGDLNWSVEKRGEGQFFGGCLARVRNTVSPVHMRITYINKVLKVELDDSKEGNGFASCMERANTDLPPGLFFGVSAATGDIPDALEMLSFEVFQLKRDGAPSSSSSNTGSAPEQSATAKTEGVGEVVKYVQMLQNNFNAVIGPMLPGDRNVQQRLGAVETQLKALNDRLASLSELLTKVVSKSAAVDPGALLHTLNDIRDNTRNQLHALAVKAGATEQQAMSIAHAVNKNGGKYYGWVGFVIAQIILLLAYQLIKKKFEDKSKKFI